MLSVVTALLVAAMCLAVLLTAGRSVGAQNRVLDAFDSSGARTIVVRADDMATVDPGVVKRLRGVAAIEWIAAFGAAKDVTNSRIPGGARVPLRMVWGDDLTELALPDEAAAPGSMAWGSAEALAQLGMDARGGVARARDGRDVTVMGALAVPDFMRQFEPVLLAPGGDVDGDVALIVVVVDSVSHVAAVKNLLDTVVVAADGGSVRISVSDELATLRAEVGSELGGFASALVALILGIAGLMVMAVLAGFVLLRRKDFGRRRALGATRMLIVVLVLGQVLVAALPGALLGTVGSLVVLAVQRDPQPPVGYVLSVGVLAITACLLGAVVPAIMASRRDPLRELRVP